MYCRDGTGQSQVISHYRPMELGRSNGVLCAFCYCFGSHFRIVEWHCACSMNVNAHTYTGGFVVYEIWVKRAMHAD